MHSHHHWQYIFAFDVNNRLYACKMLTLKAMPLIYPQASQADVISIAVYISPIYLLVFVSSGVAL